MLQKRAVVMVFLGFAGNGSGGGFGFGNTSLPSLIPPLRLAVSAGPPCLICFFFAFLFPTALDPEYQALCAICVLGSIVYLGFCFDFLGDILQCA
jgi:hypothetical protein